MMLRYGSIKSPYIIEVETKFLFLPETAEVYENMGFVAEETRWLKTVKIKRTYDKETEVLLSKEFID